MESPPLSVDSSRRGSVDSVEDLDAYFADYVPLSNLPTPPPVVGSNTWNESTPRSPSDALDGNQDLRGAASHLAKLVPSNACTNRRPSVTTIQDYLSRSGVPTEVLGLTACILDALSMRFAKKWRNALALSSSTPLPLDRTHLRSQSAPAFSLLQTAGAGVKSTAEPELLVLAALSLASSYLDDAHVSLQHWANHVSNGVFAARHVAATHRCVLQDLDYDLHSFTPDFIQDAVRDMQRASKRLSRCPDAGASLTLAEEDVKAAMERCKPKPLFLQGATSATWCNGLATPEPSPGCDGLVEEPTSVCAWERC
ncbi:uncharacterized protein K452DRAFT_279411 [Aplosporella prunicola CBS 121167]|uniref:Cyclin N-terminal domain-containing protein n=1 Tax=Aplosporella prunicola CBS 121167 TaxID=1176127 RepID=A0A6A6B078_9PEZI|nr:uncharacterized protein K452DRAFT_279411 [Aplosporella prunicola CBS 121167]KAF2136843.1 hypothetical protein K452DRAFT_279411 [Aplosporella prunicola CBS 121167]